MTATLEGMTQDRWNKLTQAQRDALRDNSKLSPQLIGLEGWRVEVTTDYEITRRFIVGRSTGWRPCHLEISKRTSRGGVPAHQHYRRVVRLYKVR